MDLYNDPDDWDKNWQIIKERLLDLPREELGELLVDLLDNYDNDQLTGILMVTLKERIRWI